MRKREEEYKEIKKMGEDVGIFDLMKLYGEYKRIVDMSIEYLQEMSLKFTFSTTDTTS